MVMSVENGPSCDDMALAESIVSAINNNMTELEIKNIREKEGLVEAARNIMTEFNGLHAGCFAVHPELDPVHWPAGEHSWHTHKHTDHRAYHYSC